MKRIAIVVSVFLLSLCLFSSCSGRTYADGYEDGYEVGYDDGWIDGYSVCEDEYSSCYDDGYYDGYSEGNTEGYYEVATYTCLFYNDVDRAFKCAMNGFAFYTFVDAYDLYVSDIYDDEDTRIDLVWALISAVSDTGVTAEERSALISAFGIDLFTRNGIDLG